jgi:hypothetical protein
MGSISFETVEQFKYLGRMEIPFMKKLGGRNVG